MISTIKASYKSSGPHGFREEDFFTFFFPIEANDPGRGQLGPQENEEGNH